MKNIIFTLIILVLVIALSASLRSSTFYLPHNRNEDIFYLALAMKLDKFGLKGYNLKDIHLYNCGDFNAIDSSGSQEEGAIIKALEQGNVFYYSKENISNMPPVYSFLLMLSHRIFSPHKLYLYLNRNLGLNAIFLRPRVYLKVQFYAVWINFVLSLLFISTIFFIGRLFFDERAGLWASLLMAIAPVDILASQRLWSDEMVSFFTALCVLLFWQGRKKNSLLFIILSGISAGIAALTKQSGLFIIPVIYFSVVLTEIKQVINKNFLNVLLDRHLVIFVITSVSVCAFWYIKIALAYGVPWYMPSQEGIEKAVGWFRLLSLRPRYGQLYYFVYLSPLFILFYLESIRTLFRKIFTKERVTILVWFFVFTFFLIIIGGKEERYMLPAYPAMAIFSGLTLEKIRLKLNSITRISHLGNMVVVLAFFITGAWSISLCLDHVFIGHSMFPIF